MTVIIQKVTENSEKTVNNKNLTPFKPGQSGNPGGRPKKLPVTDYLLGQLETPIPKAMLDAMKEGARQVFSEVYGLEPTFGQMIAFKLVQLSAKGDVMALRELLDRVEGKVAQKTQVTGLDDGPLKTAITVSFVRSNGHSGDGG